MKRRTDDEFFMRRALALARRGLGRTSPNPVVGAVLVRNGEIIGQGYHRRYGGPHAEIEAMRNAGEDVAGATMYVTLEPCCHRGKKTPPCLDTLLGRDLTRVVIGTVDPNPEVNGRSARALEDCGIETTVGVLEGECRRLNEAYLKFMQTRIPFVTLKVAQTLDGKIASSTGDARWISSEPSRRLAHRLRSFHDAVVVGIGTVLADDPRLTVRLARGRNPLRVVVDSRLRTPLSAAVLKEQDKAPTLVAATVGANSEKVSGLGRLGVEVLTVGDEGGGRVDIEGLLRKLGERNVSSVLVEGGQEVITSFVRRGLADKFVFIVAAKIMGSGVDVVGDLGVVGAEDALRLAVERTFRSGEDVVIEAGPRRLPDRSG